MAETGKNKQWRAFRGKRKAFFFIKKKETQNSL
jgi:hypothetical protein